MSKKQRNYRNYLHEDDSHVDNDNYDYIDDDYLTDEDYEKSAEIIKAFRKGYRDGYDASKKEALEGKFNEEIESADDQIYPTQPNTLLRRIIKQQPNYVGLFNKPHDNYPEYIIDTNMQNWCDRVNQSIKSTKGVVLKLIRFTPAGFDTDYEGLLTVANNNSDTEQYYVRFK